MNAQSIIGTKEISKISKNELQNNVITNKITGKEKKKIASVSVRETQTTARSSEEERTSTPVKEEKTENKSTKQEAKQEAKKENKASTKKEEKTTSKKTSKKTEQKTSSTKRVRVRISKGMDLTKRTGLTKEQFKKMVKHVSQDTSKFFYNNADYIYDLCQQYQINEIFFCGLISAESGWNIVGNHRRTHNYISLMRNGKLIHYSSTEEGLRVAAQKLHYNYLTPGGKFYKGKTLAGVKTYFCPTGGWVNLVYGRMSQMMTAAKKI